MDRTIDQVLDDALHLPAEERVVVAERLYASLNESAEHRAARQEEIRKRLAEYRAGKLQTHSETEVRERISALLR
jgi:putative addiction module component (TIGR02574 family)